MRVVAAMILRTDVSGVQRVLAGRRTAPPALAGRWEFPGGKVEAGESDEEALVREIREELGVDIAITAPFGNQLPMIGGDGVWQPYLATVRSGEPQTLDHDRLLWLSADELAGMRWLSSDVPVLEPLAALLRS